MSSNEKLSHLNLHEELANKLVELNFNFLKPVQFETIPVLMQRKDVIVQASTGTGKTLAFVIPIIDSILKSDKRNINALIIAPTRELSIQIKAVIDLFHIRCKCFIGGKDITEDYNTLETEFSIAVGTPGRLVELIGHNNNRFRNLEFLILDEADKLLSYGFEQKLMQILRSIPKSRTSGLFSATIDEALRKLSMAHLRSPTNIKINSECIPGELELKYVQTESKDKLYRVLKICKNKKAIVFFATCNQVDFVYNLLDKVCLYNILKIHGKMAQVEREKIYSEFIQKDGILLCTDVSARGIDFKNIDIVIHYDIPKDFSNIVHRSGRAARNGEKGCSFLFIMPNELAYLNFLKIKGIDMKESELGMLEINLRQHMDDEMYSYAARAFVSYVRSYKEHLLQYILNYKELDFESVADQFLLKQIPGMTELRNIKFNRFQKPDKNTLKAKSKKAKKQRKTKRSARALRS